jgi:hypothetical protein
LRSAVAPVGIGLSLLALVHLSTDRFVFSGADPSARIMRGFGEMAAELDLRRQAAGADWIGTVAYGTTGEVAFWLRGSGVPVIPLHEPSRYRHLPESALGAFGPGLVVMLDRRRDWVALTDLFETVEALPPLVRSANGHPVRTYLVFRVADPIQNTEVLVIR